MTAVSAPTKKRNSRPDYYWHWLRVVVQHILLVRSRLIPLLLLLLAFIYYSSPAPPSRWLVNSKEPAQLQIYVPSSSQPNNDWQQQQQTLGAIVFLAPQRNEGSIWGIDRFCMLLRAVRSVDQHINRIYQSSTSSTFRNTYPIYILVAKDYALDPRKKDAAYTKKDRALIRRWAPHSNLYFQEIDMYSQEALEPTTTVDQILQWRKGEFGAVPGRDLGYASMCRLWSGRLQTMSFLQPYEYYLRMDDDSLLTDDFPFDPFQTMKQHNLTYAYRRASADGWGIDELWRVSRPYLDLTTRRLPFVDENGEYGGGQPYNNFHVSKVSFWKSPQWRRLWDAYNANHLFYKYRVGDANVHAIALMTMGEGSYQVWPDIPYVHNSNDYGPGWGTKAWGEECRRDYGA